MREIVEEFQQLSAKIKEMQEVTDHKRKTGAFIGVVGIVILAFLTPVTAGLSAAIAAAAAGAVAAAAGIGAAVGGAVGGAVAATGGAVIVKANITKIMAERGGEEKVQQWGKELIALVEPMKEDLDEIKTTCEQLQEESAKVQAENTQTDMEKFQRILSRVSLLKSLSEGALIESLSVLRVLGNMELIGIVFRVTPTPEVDKKLGDAIIQSADQSEKVVNEFNEMEQKLRGFRGH